MKVYDYQVDGSRHCREGVAVEERHGLFDTFWGSGTNRHRLTESEAASAVLRFDTDDYDELDQYLRKTPEQWRRYAPADRQTIPSQHGLQLRYFIRKGAEPDLATQIANAEAKIAACESEVRLAQSSLGWAREELARLARPEGGESA